MKNIIFLALLAACSAEKPTVSRSEEAVEEKPTSIPLESVKITNQPVKIINQKNVVVKDLHIRGIRQGNPPLCILVKDSSNVTIDNVTCSDVKSKDNAHGILVTCKSACRNITIKNSHFYDLDLGKSEAVAINGDVDGFKILNNKLHDLTNIAIDAIGGEGTGDDKDYARNGLIEGNEIWNVASPHAWAACIYVDGGRNIVIRNNKVKNCQIGIEAGSEHRQSAQNVTITGNTIESSTKVGLMLGSYKWRYGGIDGCIIKDNVFIKNRRDLIKQYKVKNCEVK